MDLIFPDIPALTTPLLRGVVTARKPQYCGSGPMLWCPSQATYALLVVSIDSFIQLS